MVTGLTSVLSTAWVLCLAQAAVPTPDDVGRSVAPLVDRVKDSVVTIQSTKFIRRFVREDPFSQYLRERMGLRAPQARREAKQGLGSGFIIDRTGIVLTNNHVVAGADDVRVLLSDHRSFKAKVVGSDPATDVAVVKIADPPKNLKAAVLGDSEALRVGDYVLAIGNPLGLGQTVTMGIVSAKNRMLDGKIIDFEDFIQTDAAINQGNSGGPLFNFRGEVVGVNSAILNPAMAMNVGFAIPIKLARQIAGQILETGRVARGFLGVATEKFTAAKAKRLGTTFRPGVLVNVVERGSPAAEAGVLPNDVITAIAGRRVDDAGRLATVVKARAPGEVVTIELLRSGRILKLKAKLADRPKGAPLGTEVLGMQVSPITKTEAEELGVSGVKVLSVASRGPASGHLREGDIIVLVNRRKATVGLLKRLEQHLGRGGWARLVLIRDGYQLVLTLSGR